jgi:hypothetical protein
MKYTALLIAAALFFVSLIGNAQDKVEDKRFITKKEVWGEEIEDMIPGLIALQRANKYGLKLSPEEIKKMGFKSKDEHEKLMANADKSEDCLKKLNKANANSYVPVRYVGDSSELLIHIDGTKVQLYTPTGMVEIEGTNCKAVDGSKNVVDGLIQIANRSVEVNSRKGVAETEQHKKEQSKRVIEMLQTCGQVDSKFEDYAKKTLKQSYNTDFVEGSAKPTGKSSKSKGAG